MGTTGVIVFVPGKIDTEGMLVAGDLNLFIFFLTKELLLSSFSVVLPQYNRNGYML